MIYIIISLVAVAFLVFGGLMLMKKLSRTFTGNDVSKIATSLSGLEDFENMTLADIEKVVEVKMVVQTQSADPSKILYQGTSDGIFRVAEFKQSTKSTRFRRLTLYMTRPSTITEEKIKKLYPDAERSETIESNVNPDGSDGGQYVNVYYTLKKPWGSVVFQLDHNTPSFLDVITLDSFERIR